MDVVLGVDLGTSGLKAVALGVDGAVLAQAERGYSSDAPRPGWAETDVAVWRGALDGALAELVPLLAGHAVRGLGLAGQMHGLVLVDDAGTALAPALLWPDQRAGGQLDRWRALPADDRAALANPLVAGMTGPLLAWLVDHRPGLVARAAAAVLPKDALRATLVPGPVVTDRSDASATLLWDVPGDCWSAPAVAAAGVGLDLCPRVSPAHEVVGTAALPGALAGVPVVVGGADTPLAWLATGSATVQVNLGTGVQLLRPVSTPRPVADPVVHTYADAADGWYAMAALQNGGLAWDWVRGVLGMDWPELLATLDTSPPGAGGVAFAPWLTGERGGVAGPADRGAWTGLHPGTTRADLGRAALEGVAGAIAAAADLLDPPADDTPVALTGGGARTPAVQQLVADALGRPVRHVGVRSSSATGAALLAARGVGLDVVPRRSTGPVVDPRGHRAERPGTCQR
ncbi:FGGY family carbohydrate kinase [Modestobacter sp. Leaf380]|uniref:FGGY family carbohydrate kinase n=1 Tax=Modestobacter sp. Leaf380 TaxID=1736356 RepID=UPI0006FBDDBE|nr:FGGY family carbohydrate kinase [Modestobacter sp. Leaf380]KQS73339.1 carbohydrate kinase [Modestobacter sp. Leaf380]